MSETVDIVIPAYCGIAETTAAIESVLASRNEASFELTVILDNPADAGMSKALENLAAGQRCFTLLRNEENLGFVRTANRGMALHPDRDVLLLNSDTAVSSTNWLDRLRAAAYGETHTGTATPFSNNATICSYPRFCRDNALPAGHTVETLDALCKETNAGRTVEIPVAVGFCMYIRRDCLAQTGLFDAETFGLGYGEENDFCMRAAKLGWRHVLAGDVFVQHHGGLSFQGQASELKRVNSQKLNALHPSYPDLVDSFISRDPIRPLRRDLDWRRLQLGPANYQCLATNTLPGGTERHVQQRAQEIRIGGGKVVILRYTSIQASLEIDGVESPNVTFALPEEHRDLRQTLARLGIGHIHIHQIVEAPLEVFDLGIPFDLSVHDYGWICPQVTLLDQTHEYCGEPANIEVCEACYQKLGPHKDWHSLTGRSGSVQEMRLQNIALLERAETVRFPSADVERRMLRYAPRIRNPVVAPHQPAVPATPRQWRRSANERARVAYIGSLGYSKGYQNLYALALDALKRALPINYYVIGGTADTPALVELGIRVLGPYEEDEVDGLIAEVAPHLALFPGLWPETYSYTLTIAFENGLWPLAYDLGAIAERIRHAGYGTLVPLGTSARAVNELLLELA